MDEYKEMFEEEPFKFSDLTLEQVNAAHLGISEKTSLLLDIHKLVSDYLKSYYRDKRLYNRTKTQKESIDEIQCVKIGIKCKNGFCLHKDLNFWDERDPEVL